MITWNPLQSGPLESIKVLDLSRLVAGNMLSLQLADFGADVIKIEPQTGDPLRAWQENGIDFFWKTYSRNKRSVQLNLRDQSDQLALWHLIEQADVFIENYRPGTLEKMGFCGVLFNFAYLKVLKKLGLSVGVIGVVAVFAILRTLV